MDAQTYVTTASVQFYPDAAWWGALGVLYRLPGGTAFERLAPDPMSDGESMARVRLHDIYLPPATGLVPIADLDAGGFALGPGLREGGTRQTCGHGHHHDYHCLPCLYARWTERARERGLPLTTTETGGENHG